MIDAHAHLSLDRISGIAHEIISQLRKQNLEHMVLGGIDPADWQRQLDLSAHYPGFLTTSAGIHPWIVRDQNKKSLEAMFIELSQRAHEFGLIGEIGLDFYNDHSSEQISKQTYWCERQLDLARSLRKSVVLHVVRGHDHMLRSIKNFPGLSGIIHAYTKSPELAQEYKKLGFVISLGRHFFRAKDSNELMWLQDTPFLLESDAPQWKSDEQDPQAIVHDWLLCLRSSAQSLAKAFHVSEDEIWSRCKLNLGDLGVMSRV
jgi:TatD DNase family protein